VGDRSIQGKCHCGAFSFEYFGQTDRLVFCNCSICRRLRALWAHDSPSKVEMKVKEGALLHYSWGDEELAFNTCRICGCTVSWTPVAPDSIDRMAVNMAMAHPQDIADIPARHFDGADSWEFLD